MAANLAAKAILAIPSASEVDEAGTIRGVFMQPDDELSENGAAGVVPTAYVSRLLKFFGCSREVYIIAQVYVVRLLRKHPNFVVQACSVNEMLLASVVLALKWHEEVCEQYPDAHYALFGGVPLKKLQQLEASFLELLGWELHVSSSEFCMHSSMVVAMVEQEEGNDVSEEEDDEEETEEELEEEMKGGELWTVVAAMASLASHDKLDEMYTPPTCDDSDHEHACKGREAEEDDEECFPGRPLWGPQSYWMPSAYNAPSDDAAEDACSIYSMPDGEDCLPGKPLWGDQSYRMNSFCSTSAGSPPSSDNKDSACSDDESENEDCLPGRPLWSARSFRVPSRCSTSPGTSMPESETEENEQDDGNDDCLPGRPLWGAQSYRAPALDNTPTGSHTQFNSATNSRTHSKEVVGASNDCRLPFSGWCVAGILDSKLTKGLGGDGSTPPCMERWIPCRTTQITRGKDDITTSPTSAGPCRASLRHEKAGPTQLFMCYTTQAPAAAWLGTGLNHDDLFPKLSNVAFPSQP